jgi:hypothetical protein
MYKFGREKTPKVKNVERKHIETAINATSTQAFYMEVKFMDAAVDYSRSVDERMN